MQLDPMLLVGYTTTPDREKSPKHVLPPLAAPWWWWSSQWPCRRGDGWHRPAGVAGSGGVGGRTLLVAGGGHTTELYMGHTRAAFTTVVSTRGPLLGAAGRRPAMNTTVLGTWWLNW